jgi:hypothetical protein
MIGMHKRSGARKRGRPARFAAIRETARAQKKFQLSVPQQEMHEASTGFQQMLEQLAQMLDPMRPAHYA